jgi:hypothetical protein
MKDYKIWTQLKSRINNSNSFPLWFKEKNLVCEFRRNIGFEEDGRSKISRPVLVLKKVQQETLF